MKVWLLSGALVVVAGVSALATLKKAPYPREVSAFATTLDGRSRSQRHNALLAINRINGARIGPGETFSFNQTVGSFSRDQGYRRAPVSYNGQLITDWGGGVCQVSTTLYNAALLAGFDMLERHRHQFCPAYVQPGRDAAVAYPGVDLRVRNPYPFAVRIRAEIDDQAIRIGFVAPSSIPKKPAVEVVVSNVQSPTTYALGESSGRARVRNTGKRGYDVAVYRRLGNERQLISRDSYPVMNRVVQYDPF